MALKRKIHVLIQSCFVLAEVILNILICLLRDHHDQKISKLNSYFPLQGDEWFLIFKKQKDIMTSHGIHYW